jgi:hypothetical protein
MLNVKIYIQACMQVNYLRWWRAGGQKGGDTEQLCTPYVTAMLIVYWERWIEVQVKCAIYRWMRRKMTNKGSHALSLCEYFYSTLI